MFIRIGFLSRFLLHQTVLTKIGAIENEFRVFDMEVIAGTNVTEVEVKVSAAATHTA